MKRPQKHSLTLKGHRTSVSLEPEFWEAFRRLSHVQGKTLNALAAEIDKDRGIDRGLASAIRVYVLKRLEEQLLLSSENGGQRVSSHARLDDGPNGA